MIKIDRLMHDLERIAQIGALDGGGVRRPAMSETDKQARQFLVSSMKDAGLNTWSDAAGNVFGRWEPDRAAAARLPPVLVGSHIDTIEAGGRFDGVLGVFGALECVRAMGEAPLSLRRPVEIVAFNDEEERFLPFLGSRALVGELGSSDIEEVVDGNGVRLTQALQSIGCDPNEIASARRDPRSIAAFVELHIEQGPLLDRDGQSVGIVERIKGDYRWEVVVAGRTDHAGAPRENRADAFMALHTLIGGLRTFHQTQGGADSTLTVGWIDIDPNIETAQPGTARCSVDFRSSDLQFLKGAEEELRRLVDLVSTDAAALKATYSPILKEDPVDFDSDIQEVMRRSAEKNGYPWRFLASGAGHDAQILGRHVPAAMLFAPSVDGRSHCPEEYTRTEDIERAVTVLCDTLIWMTMADAAGGEPRERHHD